MQKYNNYKKKIVQNIKNFKFKITNENKKNPIIKIAI